MYAVMGTFKGALYNYHANTSLAFHLLHESEDDFSVRQMVNSFIRRLVNTCTSVRTKYLVMCTLYTDVAQ